jgi:hypothetical protein
VHKTAGREDVDGASGPTNPNDTLGLNFYQAKAISNIMSSGWCGKVLI